MYVEDKINQHERANLAGDFFTADLRYTAILFFISNNAPLF